VRRATPVLLPPGEAWPAALERRDNNSERPVVGRLMLHAAARSASLVECAKIDAPAPPESVEPAKAAPDLPKTPGGVQVTLRAADEEPGPDLGLDWPYADGRTRRDYGGTTTYRVPSR